jgi:uncharacterized protein (TIGR00255 family)
MKSMTGFGVATASNRSVELEISLKSVNGRFLDVRLHSPREYTSFESEIKKLITEKLARGTVDVYIQRRLKPAAIKRQVIVQSDLAQTYLTALKKLGKDLKIKGAPTLDMIVRLPDILKIEETSQLVSGEKELVLQVLSEAVKGIDSERKREGSALREELRRQLGRLSELHGDFKKNAAQAAHELAKRFRDRLTKLGFEGQLEDARMAQEIVVQADRADIAEEIVRLGEHLVAYTELLKSNEAQGKKMDFYAQELLREVNTIGSKSQVAALTAAVVEAKTVVERIREQVQNIE